MANEYVETTLMDGFAGGPHITEEQTGVANQGLYGPDDYVLEGGRQAEAQVLTNNSIRIFDAVYVIQGRRDVIAANDYTDVGIDNGAQGMNRNDLIVRRYTKDESSEIENVEYAVIKGTPVAGEATDPEVTTGDIRSGAILHEMKLYRVKLEGLNIVAVEPLFKVLLNMSTLNASLSYLAKITEGEITPYTDREIVFGSSLKRQGNMVELLLNVGTTASIAVGHRLADIPAEYAPSEDIIVSVTYFGNTYAVSINSNGTVTNISSGAIPAGETLRIHETYFINS